MKNIDSLTSENSNRKINLIHTPLESIKRNNLAKQVEEKYKMPTNTKKTKYSMKKSIGNKNWVNKTKPKQKIISANVKDKSKNLFLHQNSSGEKNKYKDKLEEKIDRVNEKLKYFTKKLNNEAERKYSDLKYKTKRFYD